MWLSSVNTWKSLAAIDVFNPFARYSCSSKTVQTHFYDHIILAYYQHTFLQRNRCHRQKNINNWERNKRYPNRYSVSYSTGAKEKSAVLRSISGG